MSKEERVMQTGAYEAPSLTDEERIDLAAAAILEKYRAAFEELAK